MDAIEYCSRFYANLGKSQSPASTVYCHQTQQIQAPSYLSKVSTKIDPVPTAIPVTDNR